MWVNSFAGGLAANRAKAIAKANRGFSVDVGSYKGIRPALAVFSDISDLLKSGDRWHELIDNYLPLSWEEFKSGYLCEVEHKGFSFLLRAYCPDHRLGWVVVAENDLLSPERYLATPEFNCLKRETQALLTEKFKENLERAKILYTPA